MDAEEKSEKGTSLMFIGLAVWVGGLLVLFYLPAGIRLGQKGAFVAILAALGILGAGLMAKGWMLRRGTSE
jgi:phosphatidylserine synthase